MKMIIRQGSWLYDGAAAKPVFVLRLDFDFWFEVGKANGDLEPDEKPELNSDGFLYYVCFRSDPLAQPGWVDSQGFAAIDDACAWAEANVPSPIKWK